MDEKNKKDLRIGYTFITLFLVFILAGIIHKRVFHRPQFMMAWHLPAAVFLVFGGKNLTKANRQRYYQNKI